MDKIKPSMFGTLPTVLDLDISYNRLTDISRGSLSNLASCRKMDVSHNMLQKIFMMPISLGYSNEISIYVMFYRSQFTMF